MQLEGITERGFTIYPVQRLKDVWNPNVVLLIRWSVIATSVDL